ncbi:MAG: DUF4384 domain-containing protein [Gemmatimonadota bacterium]
MLLALTLTLALSGGPNPTPAFAAKPGDPPIRLTLSNDVFYLGQHAKVRVRTETDGYLLVLRMDGEGRVRVLFPLDPDDSTTIRGGKDYEVKSRGDREAFMVDESTGVGSVLAVISAEPFDFSSYVRGRHWDYRALSDSTDRNDPEASLLDIVDRMAPARYEYDLARYTVVDGRNYPTHARYYGPSYYYDPWSHPFSGFWGPRFGFGFGFGFGGRPYRRHRYWW